MKKIICAFRMTEADKENLIIVARTLDRNPSDALRILLRNAAREIQASNQKELEAMRPGFQLMNVVG